MRKSSSFSSSTLLAALAFGGAALAIVAAGLTVPLPGSTLVTDPRELFATIGAALTGPVGGVVVGVLAGALDPGGAPQSVFAHVVAGLWLGFAYRRVLYDHLQMPAGLVVWALLVLAYYYVFLVPGFVLGGIAFNSGQFEGAAAPLAGYVALGRAALPEALITTIVTTAALAALPRRYRRPLW